MLNIVVVNMNMNRNRCSDELARDGKKDERETAREIGTMFLFYHYAC